ncbi:MAG: ATP-binding cassette domain-containing protein [Coriobacteriia bacterium]|nr:ATP-binding cassette domain-containing protein [Coriobacteriia bacterium]
MLQAKNLSKKFDGSLALDELNCTIPARASYGVVGSNGAGKSTLLRLLAGIYKPDAGEAVLVDESGPLQIYENVAAKGQIILVPDELYFLSQSSLKRMGKLYARAFPDFDDAHFQALVNLFRLPYTKAIRTFSKGMKRQAAIILALAARPRYLLLDEAFDGLDPTMRDLVRQILARDIETRGTTVVISSHSLRELEDTCEWLALLHEGKLIFQSSKAELVQQAPQGLEALFVERLREAGYSFDNALAQIYARPGSGQMPGPIPPPAYAMQDAYPAGFAPSVPQQGQQQGQQPMYPAQQEQATPSVQAQQVVQQSASEQPAPAKFCSQTGQPLQPAQGQQAVQQAVQQPAAPSPQQAVVPMQTAQPDAQAYSAQVATPAPASPAMPQEQPVPLAPAAQVAQQPMPQEQMMQVPQQAQAVPPVQPTVPQHPYQVDGMTPPPAPPIAFSLPEQEGVSAPASSGEVSQS